MRPLTHVHRLLLPSVIAAMALLSACSLGPQPAPLQAVYDLGAPPAVAATTSPSLPPLRIADMRAPPWLQGTAADYRLAYRDPLQREQYRDSRWAAPPAAMLTERLRTRLAPACAGSPTGTPELDTSLDAFEQVFTAPARSHIVLQWSVQLRDPAAPGILIQKSWHVERPSPTPDAAGAAHALAQAADDTLDEVARWVAAQLPPCR